ncbi:enoyl-CoA hydratase/isomerase-like protein [Mycena metata]|uniref:Enoyl-CoA hydratase/isomerase-like protein n=1 Tax=Mycena metata TaxID=1033252 RepID=A0AAD7HWK3_9AGAR|nr:enoyl-CoA hydratase/isomerase-like protein [Mycena metata]
MLRGLFTLAALVIGLLPLLSAAARYPSYGTLQTTTSSGVLNVVINNTYSTINLFDLHVQSDLANLIETLQANDTDIRVVVFSSANKQFFIGHIDVEYFLPGYASPLPLYDPGFPDMLFPVALLWNITQLPQATIAVVEGRTRGIGNEFLMSCDMRFASTAPSVLFAQLETSLGVNPGAGGGMYLSRLIGRGRAFEYVLSSADVDARTAARVGWVNRAFDSPRALHQYVQALAARIALFPAAGIIATKAGINAVSRPAREVIVKEAQDVIAALIGTPAVQGAFERFIRVTNNQSIGPVELNYGEEVGRLFA